VKRRDFTRREFIGRALLDYQQQLQDLRVLGKQFGF